MAALLVLPSPKTFDAAVAAFDDVTFDGALVWDNALPAEVFDFDPVLELVKVFDALEAAFEPVTFDFAILVLLSTFALFGRD